MHLQLSLRVTRSFSAFEEDVYLGSRPGTFITVSRVTLTPSADDDGAVLRCRAKHPAMDIGVEYPHLKDEAKITVLCE